MQKLAAFLIVLCSACLANAQGTAADSLEKRVPLGEAAVAVDATGAAALEATLRTTPLTGAADAPVTNVRLVIKNASTTPYAFVSGVVTFYDAAGNDITGNYTLSYVPAPDVVPTPEPATFATMLTGLLGIVGFANRRERASQTLA